MKTAFQNLLYPKLDFLKGKKLLLATSGGIDSMVLVDLLLKENFEIAIAHCNFQLRGIESFEDQKFIENFAQKNNIPVFITQFDTKAFAEDYKLSTQVAARELRYNWFYELLETENFDYILTAHHADDNLETFLINLSRGTGIEGLTGIPQQNEKIIRPLLAFSRNEIEAYANENQIEWREDSSNASDKYLRNKVRHHIVPLLKDLNPGFLSAFQKTQDYLQQTQGMAEDAAIMVYQQVAQEANDEIHFNLKKLKKLSNYHSYLYQWLSEFGFSAWKDIYALADSQSGKQVFSPEFRLVKNRDFLILSPLKNLKETSEFLINENTTDVNFPIKLSFSKVDSVIETSNKTIFTDVDKLKFPLILRRWNEGDVFEPFGMDGKSKKVSKFFKDEKFSLAEKEKTWLLCSGNKIIWIVGKRADERFKVSETTKNILQIALS
ncbi:tRNA(Ile)-lysidine synthase [Flavobacterium noncentrifugens]|uniref:tRNA(Ile)-lysidine synthase n=1 Tax=Flavobacterium noncentrifugens TaxID=1128970 RepID=A0A1G8W4K3_9FLAO|nr:tRNA lysidine(34) synthetase TilS [Flavobacterium noncentrifugens]GEP50764.1 tRNA(Ile)-lysidine synthase [Flavobacterium noncentrifugens]SDJ73023.1 tRNA(Ile)-lysidine synthase [Flavobacterium noncentrifugens]